MKLHSRNSPPQEIELKLCLPSPDSEGLAKCLALTPLLAQYKAAQQSLYNIYYDTPSQDLRQQRVALRLRRVGDEAKPQWLQTLKTGASDVSALSRRGEWETSVAGPALDLDALKRTPWADIDQGGSLFESLRPCFVTIFERTIWSVHRHDGSCVELALDIGHIEANGKLAPICELELELKAGLPTALFEIAREIAHAVAVLPANQSKAQRGFLLAQDSLGLPQRAQTPRLMSAWTRSELAQAVLREMFAQFINNLNAFRLSDEPEVVHQARIGWRRFKSGLRLFRKTVAVAPVPSWLELQPLLLCLGALRNLEVALTETLPPLSAGYSMRDAQREASWQILITALTQTAELQREAARRELQKPNVGASLLAISEWLENLSAVGDTGSAQKGLLRHWAKRRILRLHRQLALAQKDATTLEHQHRVRIFAKRLRYGVEALHDLLPKRLAGFCYEQAANLQSSIGVSRDLSQASVLVAMLDLDHDIAAFLRGVAVGSNLPSPFVPPLP